MDTRLSRILIIAAVIVCLPAFLKADALKQKIAVLDFELCGDKNTTNDLGSMVAEWFVTSLVKDGRFDVIERALLQKILAEQELATTGALDDSSVSKIGKILGVKIIITGSVLNVGKTYEINSRIINVEDGTIITAESIKCPSGGDLQKVVEDLTVQIVKAFPLNGYVVKKDQNTVIIDLGKGTGVQQGMEFFVFKEGKAILHPKTGEVLDVERIETGRIKISHIHGNVAEAAILKEHADGIEYGQLVNSIPPKKTTPSQAVAHTTPAVPKNNGGEGVKLVDSPIFDEVPQHGPTGTQPAEKSNSRNKSKSSERTSPAHTSLEPKKNLLASAPGCQELLKTWQLGDSSVMQRYLKECSK